jgi:hypothetical protein
MPDGTTNSAQVTNTCVPAGERPNKMPIFISGVRDTHAFLACLRASCPGGPIKKRDVDGRTINS